MAGRGELPIDLEKVDWLLMAGCDGASIARKLGIAPLTLYRRIESVYGVNFDAYKAMKRADGDDLLRQVQYEVAVHDKDKTMLVWLGKQRLDQKDKAHNEVSTPEGKRIIIEVHDAGRNTQGDEGLPTP